MKRKSLVGVILTLSLTGCASSVSEEEYETLTQKYYVLKNDYEKLKTDYEKLSEESSKLVDITNTSAQNQIFSDDYIMASGWISTVFGEDAKYAEIGSIDNKSSNYLQVVVPTDYSAEDVKTVFKEVKDSMSTLTLAGVEYEHISIQFLYPDNTEFINYSLSLEDDGTYNLSSISGDLLHADVIIKALSQ